MFRLAHVSLRYAVLALGVACVAYAAYGLMARRPHDRTIRRLASAFALVLAAQVLVGFALLLSDRFGERLGSHILAGLAAAIAAQAPVSVMKRRPPEERTYGLHLAGGAVALVLVVVAMVVAGAPLVGG